MINLLNFQKAATCIGAVFLFFSLSAQEKEFQISFESNPDSELFGQIRLMLPSELSEAFDEVPTNQLRKYFRVYVGSEIPEDPTIPSIAGKYWVTNSQVFFQPRFDPPPGIVYTAIFEVERAYELRSMPKPDGLMSKMQQTFQVPLLQAIEGDAIAVIYPTSDAVPDNLLRMYIHFNQPMGLSNPHDHVRLLDSEGQQVETPFVEVTEGLWNDNRTRLTLFFHPGRVKRGVGPNMTMGSVLELGKSYQLTFDPEWKDALGRIIGKTRPKSFQVVEADRNMLDPDKWKMTIPRSGTSEPVMLNFFKPVDHALAARMIRIIYQEEEIRTAPELFERERQILFVPYSSWKAGKYFLEIDPRFEDLAGNTMFHLFDTATANANDPKGRDHEAVRIPFEIK